MLYVATQIDILVINKLESYSVLCWLWNILVYEEAELESVYLINNIK